MGTHPIFESDFDCLTDFHMANDEVIVVEIEVGHDSEVRKEPTPEGLTHNWKVFVRGKNTKNIGSFVESIEFKLHESFSNNYRRVREHPFQVKEKGYAGFLIPIKINFRNGIHADFTYDLYLSRRKRLRRFSNPYKNKFSKWDPR